MRRRAESKDRAGSACGDRGTWVCVGAFARLELSGAIGSQLGVGGRAEGRGKVSPRRETKARPPVVSGALLEPTGAQRTLLSLLELGYGSREAAAGALER